MRIFFVCCGEEGAAAAAAAVKAGESSARAWEPRAMAFACQS